MCISLTSRLHSVALKLSSLPFELNSLTSYGFQISEALRAVVSTKSLDFGKQNEQMSGVCLTGILGFDNFKQGESGFEIVLESNRNSKDIEVQT